MPLRVRLISLVALVLLASLACGSILVGWHAANSVRTELRAALDVGVKTIRNGFDELAATIRRVSCDSWSRTFNGNRHVRAHAAGCAGQPLSNPGCSRRRSPYRGWFRWLIGEQPATVRLPLQDKRHRPRSRPDQRDR